MVPDDVLGELREEPEDQLEEVAQREAPLGDHHLRGLPAADDDVRPDREEQGDEDGGVHVVVLLPAGQRHEEGVAVPFRRQRRRGRRDRQEKIRGSPCAFPITPEKVGGAASLRRLERFPEGLQQDPEEKRRQPEQKPQHVEPAGPDDQVDDPISPRNFTAYWTTNRLLTSPSRRNAFSRIFRTRKKFPQAIAAPHAAPGSIRNRAAPASAATAIPARISAAARRIRRSSERISRPTGSSTPSSSFSRSSSSFSDRLAAR